MLMKKVFNSKEDIDGGRYCVSVGVSICHCMANVPFKSW